MSGDSGEEQNAMYEVVRPFQCENSSKLGDPFSPDHNSDETIRVVTIVTSVLSLIGAVLIIVSHLILTEGSTTSRLILAHLSIANCFATSWNWIGLWFNYKHYPGLSSSFCAFCVAQASLSNVGQNSSTFWTVVLIMHYYFLLAFHRNYSARSAFYCYLCASWIVSVLLSIWLLFDHWLGYRTGLSIPYCTIRLDNTGKSSRDALGIILGSDGWSVLSFIAVVLFYLGVKYERFRKAFTRVVPAEGEDFRFLYIPLVFPLLRTWRIVMDLLQINNDTVPFTIKVLAAIGENCQGFVNFVLYCLFAKELHHSIRSICCKREHNNIDNTSLNPSPTYEESSFMRNTDTTTLLSGIKV